MKFSKAFASAAFVSSLIVSAAPAFASQPAFPSGLSDELVYLNKLKNLTDDPVSQNEIRDAQNFAVSIAGKYHHFEIFRIKSFIKPSTVLGPSGLHMFHGDGRDFDVENPNSRTDQEIIVDLDTKQAKLVNYVGKTVMYNLNMTPAGAERASTSGMYLDVSVERNGNIDLYAHEQEANPIVESNWLLQHSPFNIDIKYDLHITIDQRNRKVTAVGVTKHFPWYEVYARTDNSGFVPIDQFYPDTEWYSPNSYLAFKLMWPENVPVNKTIPMNYSVFTQSF